jgi:hypothetical protein
MIVEKSEPVVSARGPKLFLLKVIAKNEEVLPSTMMYSILVMHAISKSA